MYTGGLCSQRGQECLGIMSDCIRPIMLGTTKQRATALPQIDPQIVAACKERNPNFGKGGSVRTQSAI
jgi:hypothetical protein